MEATGLPSWQKKCIFVQCLSPEMALIGMQLEILTVYVVGLGVKMM